MDKYLTPISVILAGVFIGGALMWNNQHPGAARPTAKAPTVVADIAKVKMNGDPFIGHADAPVTIAFWSDFQCPFCKAVETGGVPEIPREAALPDVIKNYVDTGKVKVVFMDFVFLGKDSVTAALYSRAVWKLYPDSYFTWREAMFKAQDAEGDTGFGNATTIDTLNATIPGLDAKKIAQDVKDNTATYQALIDSDRQEALAQGISSTPSFIIGKKVIAGAYPFDAFKEAIDAVLPK